MEEYGRSGQVADENIIMRMRFFMLVTKATEKHPEYAKYLLLFHAKYVYEKAPRCYVIRTLLILFIPYTIVFI